MAEPRARRGAGSAWLSSSWNRRLLLPSAASTAASPAGSPSTSNTPYALRQPGSRAAGQPDRGGRRRRRLSGCSAPAQRRGHPGGVRQPRLQPAPPGAFLQQRLRRTREEGWARECKGTTSHSEASSHCQPPSSAAQTRRRGTKSVAAGRGDTRGGAEGAEDRPFVMSPGKRQGSLCEPVWDGVPGGARRKRVPLGVR